jgi:hypothetical protein
MGNIDSRNERFYNLCGLGKAHLIEKMLESDRTLNTINVNWVAFETQSTPLLIVRRLELDHFDIQLILRLGIG